MTKIRHRRCAPAALITALAGLALTACSSPSAPARQPAQANQPLSTGLNTLVRGEAPPAAPVDPNAAPSDADTASRLALMEQALANSTFSIDSAQREAPPAQVAPRPEPAPVEPAPLTIEPVLSDEAIASAAPQITPDERVRRATGEIVEALVRRADESNAPAGPLAALAALDFAAAVASPDSQNSSAGSPVPASGLRAESRLTPREADALRAWRGFLASAQATLSDPGAGPAALAEPARALADSLGSWTALSIPTAALCSRVEGYGTYREFPRPSDGYRFLARSATKLIVYAEVEHFGRTSKSRDGVWGHEVSLTQSLELFHAAGTADTLVWQRPEQAIVDFSRRPRRDFFTVQVIDLPANLGVGAYRLKLTVTDKATGAVAESIIPFELVADASAMR